LSIIQRNDRNLEQLIIFHLKQNNICGNFSNEHGYYFAEYNKSSYYKEQFEKSGLTIDDFYKNLECFS
jgi:hypothetical protein